MATILIVDDRPSNRQFLTTLLGYGGHRLLEAGDGAQALDLVRAKRPDLVVTDILMPTMDGYEFVQQLRADPEVAPTPVIFYTATYSTPQAEALAKSCGVHKVLAKPCEPKEILDAVNQALGIGDQRGAAPPAAVGRQAGAAARRVDESMTLFLKDIEKVKQRFDDLVADSTKLRLQRDAVKELSQKFAENVTRMQRLTTRLSALLEVGMEMMTERDPARLVELFFAAACDLIDCKYAAVGMLDESEQAIRYIFTRGFDAEVLRGEAARTGLLGSLLSGQRVLRMHSAHGAAGAEGLPAGHPPVRDLLGIPVASAERVYGWMYFADRRGQDGFSEEDTRLATVMTTKLALLYENAMLYDGIQRHAAELQIEMTERKQAEEKVRRLNRVYAVLSGINGLIVRVRDRDELFREACRIAVEAGGFRMAWLGVVDREAMQVKPVAWHGTGEDYIQLMPLELGDAGSAARGLAGQAVKERKAMISNDMTHDPRMLLRKEALERGFHSLVLLPLLIADEAAGVLGLCAGEVGFFDEDELKLLHELAGDIAFALDHIEKAEKLDYLAYYDALTGLANRTLFHERLAQHVAAANAEKHRLALVIIDIERFKTINDNLGRQAGDLLLKQAAERLRINVPVPTHVARLSADHFAILLPEAKAESDVARWLRHLTRKCLGEPFRIGDTELRVSAKAGIALSPADGDADTLFKHAEAALENAKRTGEPYLFYEQAMSDRVAGALTLENQLRRALEREEFVLHYQPKVDLASRRIVGMEALIRWMAPEGGLVPPAKFIPLLEETGLILPVGAWAMRKAAQDYRELSRQGVAAPRVAVNVSAVQLRRRNFVQTVRDAIEQADSPPGIDLEITESLVMEGIAENIEKLNAVRDLGLQIAIDDFGTGYSSLAYLAKLPVQALKIDRSFIIKMLDDPNTMTLVQTIISLAHSLKLKVVAEGVDAEEQAKVLRLLRCDEMQGYLFSKPLPLAEMTEMLDREKR